MLNTKKIRKDFPITKKAVYLNHAAIGPSNKFVAKEVERWLSYNKSFGDLYFSSLEDMLDDLDIARKQVGRLINARNPSNEITFTYNTSYGLSAIAEAIKWTKGQQIVLNDLEYTSNSYTYQVIAKKNGLTVDVVNNKNGRLLLEDFEKLLSDRTRLIAISHVQFSNGFRTDLKELSALAHDHGAEIIVDGIQSLGAVPLDVQAYDIDYLSAGGYKWQLGPMNTAYMYAKESLAKKLNPVFLGSMSDRNPLKLTHHTYSPALGMKRFQASLNPNPEILGLAIDYLVNVGIDNIYNHILGLHDIIIERVSNDDRLSIKSPMDDGARSNILSVNAPNAKEIVDKLRQKYKICVSCREGAIRVSPHLYNTPKEINFFLDKLQQLMN